MIDHMFKFVIVLHVYLKVCFEWDELCCWQLWPQVWTYLFKLSTNL